MRPRPSLMTMTALLAALPLELGSGAGSEFRASSGVIAVAGVMPAGASRCL